MGRQVSYESGFTLAETILVLIVGTVLVGSATVLFSQLRENVGAAAASQRAVALQSVVEKLVTQNNGENPSADALRAAWISTRGSDYQTSPWGGMASCTDGAGKVGSCITYNNYAVFRDITIDSTALANRCFGSDTAVSNGDSGLPVYIHLAPLVFENHLDIFDHSIKLFYHANRYAVAIESTGGRQFYFVHGPLDIDTTPNGEGLPRSPSQDSFCVPRLEGQVGEIGQGSDPYRR
ncbi:MAG: hypothetical protein HY692_01010 [Cyanobacteria bacterium NC_groundwater_1444_Ag_S-0.65um_54_12]|nr:hypothetical protein [Cyanobacteria bacterium NC_groundwater_1444_Ag_S-0.65um_54_12]